MHLFLLINLSSFLFFAGQLVTSAIPEPPVIVFGTVTDKTTNQPVAISSSLWQVTDGIVNQSYSATSLPATRMVTQAGQSFYVLEVPQESRIIQTASGALTLQPSTNGFEVRSPAPTYSLKAVINGQPATIKAVDGTTSPPGTTSATIGDYTRATQGRMLRVDLWVNDGTYLAWAAGFFSNANAPEAAPTADPDGDGATNEAEWRAGTHPLDRDSVLGVVSIEVLPNDNLRLVFSTVPGKRYQLMRSSNLQEFVAEGNPVTATAATTTLTLPVDQRAFFRLQVVP